MIGPLPIRSRCLSPSLLYIRGCDVTEVKGYDDGSGDGSGGGGEVIVGTSVSVSGGDSDRGRGGVLDDVSVVQLKLLLRR